MHHQIENAITRLLTANHLHHFNAPENCDANQGQIKIACKDGKKTLIFETTTKTLYFHTYGMTGPAALMSSQLIGDKIEHRLYQYPMPYAPANHGKLLWEAYSLEDFAPIAWPAFVEFSDYSADARPCRVKWESRGVTCCAGVVIDNTVPDIDIYTGSLIRRQSNAATALRYNGQIV